MAKAFAAKNLVTQRILISTVAYTKERSAELLEQKRPSSLLLAHQPHEIVPVDITEATADFDVEEEEEEDTQITG